LRLVVFYLKLSHLFFRKIIEKETLADKLQRYP